MRFPRSTLARTVLVFSVLVLNTLVLNIPALDTAIAQEWKPAEGPLMTRWAREVAPDRAHPEYPRPQMARDDWMNLNGLWEYAVRPRNEDRPAAFDGFILVPFPLESALSGVMKRISPLERLWYRRTFTPPAAWSGMRMLLHFGAVDWEAAVFVNGQEVGVHRGGYDPFTLDISSALAGSGEQEIVVAVWDPTDAGYQPRGKQVRNPRGIWYTPTTGIWQTVWLEPVPPSSIDGLKMAPDFDARILRLTVTGRGDMEGLQVKAVALDGDKPCGEAAGPPGRTLEIPLSVFRSWSPDRPYLYGLIVYLFREDEVLDWVSSYFGMRKISMGKDPNGVLRLLLNNEPLFHYGPLDQGFWPDGLYTAPTDDALKHDIEVTKKLGFNAVRKHVKIEPDRWYYWCDELGLMVWQDMPSGDRYIGGGDPDLERTAQSARQFEGEFKALIDDFYNHPSIVMWVPFNEGWGQYDTARIADWVKAYDPTRLVNNASGWADRGVGDVNDIHRYPGPGAPRNEPFRAAVLGEFGGLGLPLGGHTWQAEKNWGYRSFESREALTEAYESLLFNLKPLIGTGLAAAIYTQTTDVEIEVNGLMTYDRALIKMDPDRALKAALALYEPPPEVRTLVPTARDARVLPDVKPLFNFPVRDTSICTGPDGAYYLTGTTGYPAWWKTNDGVRVWRSEDLQQWEALGLVWSLDRDGTWQKTPREEKRALWAPEIHYLRGTFWIPYCMNFPGGGTGILKSTSGEAKGPYVDVKPDGPLSEEIDASLFEDDDGRVYFVFQNGKIAPMKDDLSGLAEAPSLLKPANHGQVGFEGAFLFRRGGRYHLACADFIGGMYHCMVASSDFLRGPYGDRYLAVPHGGHNMFFQDASGQWWSTFFGNDEAAPFRERPAILKVAFNEDGRITPVFPSGFEKAAPPVWRYTTKEPPQGWEAPGFDDAGWNEGFAGFGKADTPGALANTLWNGNHIWLRRTFTLEEGTFRNPHLLIHHDEDAEVYINGVLAAELSGYTTSYVMVPLKPAGVEAMKAGENILAVHCRQTSGGQYIDAGLVDLVEN